MYLELLFGDVRSLWLVEDVVDIVIYGKRGILKMFVAFMDVLLTYLFSGMA